MAFIYKNPISDSQLNTVESVSRDKTFGTNFSVLQVGGYMEVYTLDDLKFTVEGTGPIELSGNTIPVRYSKRTLPFLNDTLTLNSDNISSGRRRLGMLVFVHETQKTYQYTIPNFETLWDGASGSMTEDQYGTSITTSTSGGEDFIDAWLDSSIEGVSGVTRENARWKIFYGTDITVTGGTYNSGTGTLSLVNNTGGTINVTGFTSGGGSDTYLTGATYTPTTLTLGMNDGTEFAIGGFAPEITGGTYSSGTLSLLNNTGGSVDITGITFTSTNIYNTDGQLEGNRVIDQDSNSLTFSGGSVSMGTNTTNPVCALLEIASTTQGLLIPRMTQVQRLAINTPLPGLLVYCTDTDSNGNEGMYMYKSVGWTNVL